jgi:hypothetical protein
MVHLKALVNIEWSQFILIPFKYLEVVSQEDKLQVEELLKPVNNLPF